MEEVGVLGAVHQDLGPVPILGAPRAVPSGGLMAALALQRGALAARVAHGGGSTRTPGSRTSLQAKYRGLPESGSHKDPKERIGAPGTAPLGLGFLAGIRFEADQHHWQGFTIVPLPARVAEARAHRART